MYSSRDLRSPTRYQIQTPNEPRRIKPGWLILGGLAVVLLLCCCLGVFGIAYWQGWFSKLPGLPSFGVTPTSSARTPSRTPTPNVDKPVPLGTRAVAENGLEITVLNFQRPLKVEGLKGGTADQQFVLATVRIRNTKSTGAAIVVNPADFSTMGDGGLAYAANARKDITIPNLLTQTTVAPGKELTAELIFQIATNDANLRLTWNTGASNRIFLLEESK